MSTQYASMAEKVVDVVLADLADRKGIGNELEQLDQEIYESMKLVLCTKVDMALAEGL